MKDGEVKQYMTASIVKMKLGEKMKAGQKLYFDDFPGSPRAKATRAFYDLKKDGDVKRVAQGLTPDNKRFIERFYHIGGAMTPEGFLNKIVDAYKQNIIEEIE